MEVATKQGAFFINYYMSLYRFFLNPFPPYFGTSVLVRTIALWLFIHAFLARKNVKRFWWGENIFFTFENMYSEHCFLVCFDYICLAFNGNGKFSTIALHWFHLHFFWTTVTCSCKCKIVFVRLSSNS